MSGPAVDALERIKAHDEDGGRFTVDGWRGVAFWFDREETEPDEDTEWTGIENPTGRVLMVMVGDDYRHAVDPEDVEPLGELDYCAVCGQIGCTHDGRERGGE